MNDSEPTPITEPAVLPTDPAATPPAVTTPPSNDPSDSFRWQASEYLHHDKKPGWFIILIVVSLVLIAVAALTRQWFSIPVIIAMAVTVLVYAIKPPRVLNYELDDKGITIETKFHAYDDFRSFAVLQDVAWHAIDLEPAQRFMPRLTILFDSEHLPQIVSRLAEQLPEVDRGPDWVERLARYLKF